MKNRDPKIQSDEHEQSWVDHIPGWVFTVCILLIAAFAVFHVYGWTTDVPNTQGYVCCKED